MSAPQTISSLLPSAEAPEATIDKVCGTHGAFKARVLPGSEILGRIVTSHCPTCSQIARDKHAAAEVAEAERERRNKVASLNFRAGIPARFQSRTIDGYRVESDGQKRVANMARRFVESWPEQRQKGTSLIFTGGPGTGKTHIACAIGTALMGSHLASVCFGTATEMLRSIKDTYRRDSERTEQEAINSILAFDLVIIDEIGVQLGTDHEKMLLFEVLNGRSQGCLPTILLSNLNAADLEEYLGQRVMDRYRECGAVVAFDWQSHRGAK